MLYLFLLFVTVSAYHNTDDLMNRAKKACVPPCSYYYEDDILVMDWKKDLPKDIVWVFGEHARERITSELALEMIQSLKHLNSSRRITIVPVLNVWGRKHVEKGHKCQRKNKNGVDTNRNYPQIVKHKYSRSSEEYEGPYPLSEKESRLVANLIKGAKKYYNIHSGEYSLYMPYDSIYDKPPKYRQMIKALHKYKVHCPECLLGSAAKVSFYKAYGTSVDYASTLGLESYTFEIYGKNSYDCDTMFNPKGKTFDKVITMWKKILYLTCDR